LRRCARAGGSDVSDRSFSQGFGGSELLKRMQRRMLGIFGEQIVFGEDLGRGSRT
jgi:hypothetical protein